MKILDAHIHLGNDCVFDETQLESEILNKFEQHGVYGGIVQPYIPKMYVSDTQEIHNRIKKFCDEFPKRFFGMMSMNPHFSDADYECEAKRCICELGFVGVKITPFAHACNPSSKDGMKVFEIANQLGVSVMVHTGAGMPFADPMMLVKPIEAFRTTKITIAHAGSDLMNASATYLANKYDNVFVEPSWIAVMKLEAMYKKLGSSKIMFSSDMLVNLPIELAKYNEVFKSETDREQVFFKTCSEVFNLK